jgi:hypothetical protein
LPRTGQARSPHGRRGQCARTWPEISRFGLGLADAAWISRFADGNANKSIGL